MQLLGRIPLVPSINTRGIIDADDYTSRDQFISGGVVRVVRNELSRSITAYVEKVPTPGVAFDATGTNNCTFCHDSASFPEACGFSLSNSTIYSNNISAGTITGTVIYPGEVELGSTSYLLLPSTDGTGWFLAEDAQAQTSYTGDTHSNTTIDGIASTAGMYVGQAISGSGIPATTRIATVVSANAITITIAATSTAAGVTLTKTPVAKIIDADFPTIVGAMIPMDGYIFVMTADRKIYQSNLNSITAWTAGDYITANQTTGPGVTVSKYKNNIVGMTSTALEFFQNAGLPSGSVLQRLPAPTNTVGVSVAGNSGNKLVSCALDRLCWSGSPKGNTFSIYMLDGATAVPISTPNIDALFSSGSWAAIYQYVMGGDEYLHASNGTTKAVYSFYTKQWTISSLVASDTSTFNPVINEYGGMSVPKTLYGNKESGPAKLYAIDDSGSFSNLTLDIRVSDGGFGDGRRNFVDMVELIADTQTSGTTTLAYSDDDGSSFTTRGTFDMTEKKKQIYRCGSYKGHRIWKLTHSADTPWRGQFLDVWGTKGAV